MTDDVSVKQDIMELFDNEIEKIVAKHKEEDEFRVVLWCINNWSKEQFDEVMADVLKGRNRPTTNT